MKYRVNGKEHRITRMVNNRMPTNRCYVCGKSLGIGERIGETMRNFVRITVCEDCCFDDEQEAEEANGITE
jgi:hypothetical protein